MGTIAIQLTNGAKSYERDGAEHPVFGSLNLTVHEGEIVALLGPSGCGKSTLLRILAGLDHLTRGTADIPAGKDGRSDVGIVFQDALLLPWLTVAENVSLGLTYRANRHARGVESVDRLLEEFGLAAVAHSYPDELSGGQAQRASLARAIVCRPRVLLLDEPFAALDPVTRAGLQDWLLGIVKERGLTVVLVTHDVEEAVYLGNRVALMSPRPSTITHVWDVNGNGHRDRASAAGQVVRREIMAQYQANMPADAASSWVI